MNVFRLVAIGGIAWALAVLVASYVAIAWYSSTPWLWFVIVHESGDRTLLNTILYYEHATRELPVDVLLGMAIGGAALYVFGRGRCRRPRRAWTFTGAFAVILAIVLIATVHEGGYRVLAENLLQLPTRPGEPLVWGGHWRYHLLSQLSLILMAFGAAGAILLAAGYRGGHRLGVRIVVLALALFGLLTLFFVPKLESVRDPVFLGHQAREVFTHAIVTIPFAFGVCVLLAGEQWGGRNVGGHSSLASSVLWGAVGVVTAVYLAVGSIVTSAASQGQSESLAVLIFPHFFEHTVSYLVSMLAAALVVEWSAPVCRDGRDSGMDRRA